MYIHHEFSFGYDEKWDSPLMKGTYLHDTASGCCEVFFDAWGMKCVTEDICESSTVSTSCESAMWHPSEDYTKCENRWVYYVWQIFALVASLTSTFIKHYYDSIDYPNRWNSLPLKEAFLHDTADECCEVFFGSWGNDCIKVDVCEASLSDESPSSTEADTPCESALWHPSADYSKCVNRWVSNIERHFALLIYSDNSHEVSAVNPVLVITRNGTFNQWEDLICMMTLMVAVLRFLMHGAKNVS